MLQFAGHLRGRALLEWNLLDTHERNEYTVATKTLRCRLDPGGRALAAQDFRHTFQQDAESVGDFIRRLERTFQLAYGRDKISTETRATLLHSQLQEGLRYRILQSPTVSGAQTYGALCLGAKNEEKRQAELKKREKYRRETAALEDTPKKGNHYRHIAPQTPDPEPTPPPKSTLPEVPRTRRCYTCNSTLHLARDCPQGRKESTGGRDNREKQRPPRTNMVQAGTTAPLHKPAVHDGILGCLFSSESESDSGEVKRVQVNDKGSQSQSAVIEIEGVPARGVVDTGSDITIIGGALFKHVATMARLCKKHFKPPDRSPHTYNHQPFSLDGRMDLNISYGDKTMVTPIYMKVDAPDQLLLSEGVCRQLGIVSYHQGVRPWPTRLKRSSQERKGVKRGNVATMAPGNSEKEAAHGSKTANPGVSSASNPQDGDLETRDSETPSGSQHAEETEDTQAAIPPVAEVSDIDTVRTPVEVQSGALGDDCPMTESSTKPDIAGCMLPEGDTEDCERVPASSPRGAKDGRMSTCCAPQCPIEENATLPNPLGRVKLISSIKVPPRKSAIVPVQAMGASGTVLLELMLQKMNSLEVEESLLDFTNEGTSQLVVTNRTHFTRVVQKGAIVGTVSEAEPVDPAALLVELTQPEDEQAEHMLLSPLCQQCPEKQAERAANPRQLQSTDEWSQVVAPTNSPDQHQQETELDRRIVDNQPLSRERIKWRMERLTSLLEVETLQLDEQECLREMLQQYHHVFALEEGERGETDLIEFHIDTSDANPIRQPARRIPFAARQEISKQLLAMLESGVIQPSQSPWASPVVLVRKKDGSLRFCIDYRPLNAVTKPDLFPLPRIDDILDQIGKSRFFSTLNLASGYWQIRVRADSQEKTAFITNQGLYEFRVMPFGLTNAPAVFQRLMQQVLSGLNPVAGPDFVAVYLDDVLIFSETLDEHLTHLRQVLERIDKSWIAK